MNVSCSLTAPSQQPVELQPRLSLASLAMDPDDLDDDNARHREDESSLPHAADGAMDLADISKAEHKAVFRIAARATAAAAAAAEGVTWQQRVRAIAQRSRNLNKPSTIG